jgi:hypothetical protein
MKKYQFRINQSTQPIPAVTVKKETPEERFARLKRTADATGRRFVHVYLEDERRRKGNQR